MLHVRAMFSGVQSHFAEGHIPSFDSEEHAKSGEGGEGQDTVIGLSLQPNLLILRG